MNRKNRVILIIICSLIIFLTGCWDSIDIENRAYILGIAIDEYPPLPEDPKNDQNTSQNEQEKMFETSTEVHTGTPTYAMTVQIPIIKHATLPNTQIGGTSESRAIKTWDITQVGNSFIEINHSIATRTNLVPYYEHLQVIVISEKVARKGLENALDFFIRDPEMRSRTKLFITDGNAKDVLNVIPRIEDYASIYLAKTSQNARINAEIIHWTDLGQAIQSIYSGEDFHLPAIKVTQDEILNKGAALFKKDKMVGWAEGQDAEVIKMFHNVFIGGIFTSEFVADEHDAKDGVMSLEVIKAKTKITPIVQGDDIAFKIDINIEGNYAEGVNHPLTERIDADFLEEAKKAFEKSIKDRCIETIEKMQNMEVDALNFGTVLKTKEPGYWDRVKNKWRDIYPNVKTEVNVKVDIKQIGNIQ
ncbi:Ger(x)C family spore germination protein [Acetivibrio mesophilus]|uniref:Ger(X)C family spore germination protein n=1 Tax=Acetivibrio mesophilus TaxID=2487273 RepID=A0A4Q0I4U3_9FIRM|nr:Ger(x)C family spore germination protein [Acetivibrio mesophilus]ODM26802.1 spore gernimation protein [Clostridium sp. Bc-iso-3]RXE59333.1 Ger(x)C family spore germination protein [Acetivibrio mesophilus]HHV28410.1 Ger(x)C family spore germination protein [Clostridium sp.]